MAEQKPLFVYQHSKADEPQQTSAIVGDYPSFNWNFIPQGWVCPKCGRVYSPTTIMCLVCGNQTIKTSSGTGAPTYPAVEITSDDAK